MTRQVSARADCKSVKHRLHPKRSEEVKGRVEICEANTQTVDKVNRLPA